MNLIAMWKIPPVVALGILSICFQIVEDIGDRGNKRCEDLIEAIRER